jgi:type II secretory ATPase GspE/PulE/Tfp pilus assembly ATPase PilB-like protein
MNVADYRVPEILYGVTKDLVGTDSSEKRVYSVYAKSANGLGVLFSTHEVHKKYLQERENYKSEILNNGFTIDKEEVVEAHFVLSLVEKANAVSRRSGLAGASDSEELREFNRIMADAIKYGASDVHFIHYENSAAVHYRVNRVIVPAYTKTYDSEYLFKVSNAGVGQSPDMVGLNSKDKKVDVTLRDYELPLSEGSKMTVSIRIGRNGSQFGPHTVARIFKEGKVKSLEELRVDDDVSEILRASTRSEKGIIILCGPTGNGKSTTLNSLYDEIRDGRMIILLSDPIEETFDNPYVVQKNVFPEIPELSYNPQLKSSLRQDPDIVGITEMRDKAVMKKVVGSALTGHLMGTSMHSADPFDALIRLIESDIDKTLLASRELLQCVASQRLLPEVCQHCASKEEIEGVEYLVRNHEGCSHCIAGTTGLICVAEALRPDDRARSFIRDGDVNGLRDYVFSQGYVPMKVRAKAYVEQHRVCPHDAQRTVGGIFEMPGAFEYRKPSYLQTHGVVHAVN